MEKNLHEPFDSGLKPEIAGFMPPDNGFHPDKSGSKPNKSELKSDLTGSNPNDAGLKPDNIFSREFPYFPQFSENFSATDIFADGKMKGGEIYG
ncbi:MAG TPA: hypothetical protein VFV23_10425 [Verrucomicrobiae bacterium]|nr:hypothetical protein [Verrucomicrobiae bacterium]